MSAVMVALPEQLPRSSGGHFKSPAVLVELSVVFLVHEQRIKGVETALSRGGSPGCATAFKVDRVLRDATTLEVAIARVDAAGVASFNGIFTPCACVAADASCLVLR
jgi:hypothetical protein